MRLAGRTAVVTGGTSGVGRAIAESFLAEGAQVVCASRGRHEVDELTAGAPDRVAYVSTDVTDEDSVAAMVATAVATFGRLDVLVANAGVSRNGTIRRLSRADWEDTVSTNLTGVFLCTRAVVDQMSRQGGGRIINVSSCTASRVAVGAAAYSASKAAVEMFSRSAAVELGPKGITVNCLAPGYIDAGMGQVVAADERVWPTYKDRLVSGRLGRPEEVGSAAVFLASEEGAYVNGHVLEVNGGLLWA